MTKTSTLSHALKLLTSAEAVLLEELADKPVTADRLVNALCQVSEAVAIYRSFHGLGHNLTLDAYNVRGDLRNILTKAIK